MLFWFVGLAHACCLRSVLLFTAMSRDEIVGVVREEKLRVDEELGNTGLAAAMIWRADQQQQTGGG